MSLWLSLITSAQRLFNIKKQLWLKWLKTFVESAVDSMALQHISIDEYFRDILSNHCYWDHSYRSLFDTLHTHMLCMLYFNTDDYQTLKFDRKTGLWKIPPVKITVAHRTAQFPNPGFVRSPIGRYTWFGYPDLLAGQRKWRDLRTRAASITHSRLAIMGVLGHWLMGNGVWRFRPDSHDHKMTFIAFNHDNNSSGHSVIAQIPINETLRRWEYVYFMSVLDTPIRYW